MATRRRHSAQSVAVQTAEMAMAAPQVVMHRLTRMALAGPVMSERDKREFNLMSAEKADAFAESWGAMAAATMRANQQMAVTMWSSMLFPWAKSSATPQAAAAQMGRAALGVLGSGMAPVHKRAVANAKRLKHTRLR